MSRCKTPHCPGIPTYYETRVVGETSLVDVYKCPACHKTQHEHLSGIAWLRRWLKQKVSA